jgi:hypothetical protein
MHNLLPSPANYLRYYSDAVGHWELIFPIINYQLPAFTDMISLQTHNYSEQQDPRLL